MPLLRQPGARQRLTFTMNPHSLTEADITLALQNYNVPGYSEQHIPSGKPLRLASVLVPLMYYNDDWHLLYTRRTDRLENHRGQVAFPGGGADAGETPEQTALRESHEELGIRPADVRILGRLPQIVTISDYQVTPIVGVIPWPYAFYVHTPEVERVFTFSLTWLADKRNFMKFVREETGRHIIAYLPHHGELLWGATAHITVEFLKILKVL